MRSRYIQAEANAESNAQIVHQSPSDIPTTTVNAIARLRRGAVSGTIGPWSWVLRGAKTSKCG